MTTPRTETLRAHLLDLLAADNIVGRCGLSYLVRCLGYADLTVTAHELEELLVERARTPSAFDRDPSRVTVSYPGGAGPEWSFRHPQQAQVRRCIDAVYAVTDRLPRDRVDYDFGGGQVSRVRDGGGIEIIRPHAFAVCRGHLAARFLRGNFAIPSEATIIGWIRPHFGDDKAPKSPHHEGHALVRETIDELLARAEATRKEAAYSRQLSLLAVAA